jgi:hypothetical protein
MTAAIVSIQPAQAIRNDLRRKWQDAFDDGARCAFMGEFPGEREPGGPLDKRNAWFAGFNLGLVDRARFEEEAPHG